MKPVSILISGIISGCLLSVLAAGALSDHGNQSSHGQGLFKHDWEKKSLYGTPPTTVNAEGLRTFEPGIETKADSRNVPVYNVETNKHGIREEDAEPNKKAHTVLVLGDSFTYGWGLNRSERFTNIAESKLEEDMNVQVVNAAVPGWGFKDYYNAYQTIGEKYNPDSVIIASHFDDHLSIEDHYNIKQQIKKNISESTGPEMRNRIIRTRFRSIKQQRLQQKDPNETDIYTYSEKFHRLSEKEDFNLYIYPIYRFPKPQNKSLSVAEKDLQIDVWNTPRKLRKKPVKYSLLGPDHHYGTEAQKILASKMARKLS
jgi:hypothetical protein